jgi:very-long-chain enoyl-CoA reductase
MLLPQVGNYISHVTLSKLRAHSSGYSIPTGGLFDYVTCANYTYEIWAWIFFAIGTQSLPAALFCAAGAFQMVQWALAKHKRLRRLFDGKDGREKFSRRWVIFPPLL